MSKHNYAMRVRNNYMQEQRDRYSMGAFEMYDKTPAHMLAPKYSKLTGVFSDEKYDRKMLLRLGLGEIGSTLAIPYLPQTPRISDPDAQGVIKLVEGIQRGLNQLGCSLRTDGFLGPQTVACLKQISGRGWHEKSWLQICGDVVGAIDSDMRISMPKGQAMGSYVAVGVLGTSNEWCSKANPKPGCSALSGICKPMNTVTLVLYKDLQRQINRISYVRNRPLVDVDGRIGPETTAAVNELLGVSYPTCDIVAREAPNLAPAARRVADLAGAPKAVPDPSGSAPSYAKEDGTIVHPDESRWPLILGVAAAVGGIYWYTKKKPRPKKKKR